MEDNVSSAEAYDDLTSLFLPDILHNNNAGGSTGGAVVSAGSNLSNSSNESNTPNTNPTTQRIRQELPSPYANPSMNSVGMKMYDMSSQPYNFGTPLRQDELTSFNNFITNNDFISNSTNELPYNNNAFANYNGGGSVNNNNNSNSGNNNSNDNNSSNGGNNSLGHNSNLGGMVGGGGAGGAGGGSFQGPSSHINGNNMENGLFSGNMADGGMGHGNIYSNSHCFPMSNSNSTTNIMNSNISNNMNHNNNSSNSGHNHNNNANSNNMANNTNNSGLDGANGNTPSIINPYINHYASFMPIEAAASAAVQQPRQHMYPVPQQQSFNPDIAWFGNNQFEQQYVEKPLVGNPKVKAEPAVQPQELQMLIDKDEGIKSEDLKKKKGDNKKLKQGQLQVLLSMDTPKPAPGKLSKRLGGKLTRLLDFKPPAGQTSSEYKIIDSDNNEITIDLSGFLNGRFYTNEVDNRNYYRINVSNEEPVGGEATGDEATGDTSDDRKGGNSKTGTVGGSGLGNNATGDVLARDQPPKILSCYRRNFIQLSLNLNLSGFNYKSSKVLKLQTSKFGYSVTRVIKWFKIDILANTNFSNIENVPMMIHLDKKDKAKKMKKDEPQNVKQDFNMEWFSNQENIIHLNDEEATPISKDDVNSKREIDKYYAVKKLQFKSATPNNGKLSFQNYYNLIIRLSAVVADPYYDDYVDEFSQLAGQNNGTNNNEVALVDLVSEPMIVRGRNPSFYGERNDILIKSRSTNSKESFKLASHLNRSLKLHSKSGPLSSSDAFKSLGEASESIRVESLEDPEFADDAFENEDAEEDVEEADDAELAYDWEEDNSSDSETDSKPKSMFQPYSNQENSDKSIPPIVYSATSSSSINLKSMLNTSTDSNNSKDGSTNLDKLVPLKKALKSRYKYFPVSNVYYLPPINVVYFPHSAHQSKREIADSRESEISVGDTEKPHSPQRRKSSNVYFR